MKSLTIFFVLLTLAFTAVVDAAILEPNLEDQLLAAKPTDRFSVILKLYSPRDIGALDRELHARRAPRVERYTTVLDALKANAADTQGPVLTAIDAWKTAGEVEGYTAYWIGNLIVVYGSSKSILSLALDPAVESIGPNFKAELIEPIGRGPIRGSRPEHLDTETTTPGQNAIHATQVNRELGLNGQGVLVANCDTGVDGNHPALAARWRGTHAPADDCWRSFIGANPNFPTDTYGHGTHVMGTICGRAISGNDTITVGSAPLAEWIACDPINQGTGPGFNQDILDAYQWFADPDENPNTFDDEPDVIQNSWGVNGNFSGYTDCFADWNSAVLNCEALGIVVTWSAGNEGPSPQSLRTPATFAFNPTQIFSVGAVDATSNPNNPPYPIASFSSRGPAQCDPDPTAIKPEVCAPGVNVYSSVPGGGYDGTYSGTSMAGPHVAGCVALMREACPDCDPQTIKEALLNTAIDYGTQGDDNTYGMGFIDCYQAVLAVFNLGRVDGFVTTGGGSPLPGVRVQALDGTNASFTDATGYYTLTAAAGMHSIRFTKFGYETITADSVETIQGDTAHVSVEMNTVPMGVMVGTVTTQVGIPIQNALVYVRNTPYDTLISDVNGQVVLDSLPATTWQVWLHMTVNTDPPREFEATPDVEILAGDTTFVDLPITVTLVEPIGPDAYGYSAYDRYDRDYPAPADWVELDPDQGNPGVEFTFTHHDSSKFFQAPFTIGFYGSDRDTLTVNPNGWMLPGEIHMAGATNYAIPFNGQNPPDPPGIIAPFWDDLRIGLGARQFQYYDEQNGRWIFEFLDQRLVTPGNRFQNWEVHFLDPARHPTSTGDTEILFVYHLMQYLNTCTIGIESPSETTGLQVRFNLDVDSTAWPVEDGAAIRFTTGHPDVTGTVNGMLTLYPASNEITNSIIYVGGDMASPAANGQFTADSVAAAPVSLLLKLDGYEARRMSRVLVAEDSTTNVQMGAWRLDPVQNLSASQNNGTITLTWQPPLSVQAQPNPDLRYNVYANGVLLESGLVDTTATDIRSDGDQVSYTVLSLYRYGQMMSDTLVVDVDLSTGDQNAALPTVYALYQNYPNPFNPTTNIRLDVPEHAIGKLIVYDIMGRQVRTLYDGALEAGRYTYTWDGQDDHGVSVSTGMYLCRFSSHGYTATQKMLLMK